MTDKRSDPEKVQPADEENESSTINEESSSTQGLPDDVWPVAWRTSLGLGGSDELDDEVKKHGINYVSELKRIVEDAAEFSERRYRAMGWLLFLHNEERIWGDHDHSLSTELIEVFSTVARSSSGQRYDPPRRDALQALVLMDTPASLDQLLAIIEGATDDLYRDAIQALSESREVRAVPVLAEALIKLPNPDDRRWLAQKLRQFADVTWRKKADVFIDLLSDTENRIGRPQIDASAIIDAIVSEEEGWRRRTYEVADHLIEAARNQDKRVSGNLAELIVEAVGGEPEKANDRIGNYQTLHRIPSTELEELRVQVGGKRLIEVLHDREDYFQEFTQELNKTTEDAWQKTIEGARKGFAARLFMSIAVFVIGLLLVIVFGFRLLQGSAQPNIPYSDLIPFLSGLGVMVLITYTGPLKDIRQSVSDLGTASAAFIAFVHRVLETSHTFSYYYMTKQIDFDELKKASDIMADAMSGTILALNQKATDSSEKTILSAIKELRNAIGSE